MGVEIHWWDQTTTLSSLQDQERINLSQLGCGRRALVFYLHTTTWALEGYDPCTESTLLQMFLLLEVAVEISSFSKMLPDCQQVKATWWLLHQTHRDREGARWRVKDRQRRIRCKTPVCVCEQRTHICVSLCAWVCEMRDSDRWAEKSRVSMGQWVIDRCALPSVSPRAPSDL